MTRTETTRLRATGAQAARPVKADHHKEKYACVYILDAHGPRIPTDIQTRGTA
jgi:hypothetical protein